MKALKFTEAQKTFTLKQGEEGTSGAKTCRKQGIGQSTYFAWEKKYGGLLPNAIRLLKIIKKRERVLCAAKRSRRDKPGVVG